MSTDPTSMLPQPELELGPEPIIDTIEPPPPEPAPEEVQVAGAGIFGPSLKAAKAKWEEVDEAVVPPEPKAPPIANVVEGQLTLAPIPEASAKEFREMLNLPEDFPIELPMPNLTRGEVAGTVNIMNIEDGAVDWINNMHRIFDEQIKAAKRGERTLDQIAEDAKKMGMNEALYELMGRKVGEAFNAEQMYRALWVRGAMAENMQRIAREGSDEDFMKWLPIAASVEMQTSGAITESARTMAVLAHAGKLNITDASIESLPDLIRHYNITPETIGNIRASYLAIPEAAKHQKMHFLRVLATKGLDVWAEAFVSAILSLPGTHAVNIAGNTIFGMMQVPEKLAAGAVGMVRVNLLGGLGGKDRVYMSEALAQLQGLADGFMAGKKAAWKALRHEEGTFGQGTSKIDTRRERAISADNLGFNPQGAWGKSIDWLGAAIRFMGPRLLLAEDEFAKGLLYHMELKSLAKRRMIKMLEDNATLDDALEEGGRILSGGDAQVVKSAEDFAVRGTFQGDLGPIASWFNKGFAHPLMKIWMPFFKTPSHIVNETLQRTPLAVISPAFWTEVAQGGAKADAAIGRFTVGTGIFAGVASVATGEMYDGFAITGAGPKDPNTRAAWKRNGWKPYAFVVRQPDGNWKNYEYGRLAPIAGIIAMAADYAHYSQYSDRDDELMELFGHAGGALYNQLTELPMLKGMFEISEIFGGGYENFDQKWTRMQELMTKQVVSAGLSTTPVSSAVGGVARQINPLSRNVRATAEQTENEFFVSPVTRGFYEALNQFKSRNPFFTDDVLPRLNLWGETMKTCENGLWCFISPMRTSTTKLNKVDTEMVNLGLGLRMPSRTQKGVKLTADQYNYMIIEINTDGGEPMHTEMETLIDSDFYKYFKGDERPLGGKDGKLQLLKNVLSRRKTNVLDEMFATDSVLGHKANMIEAHQRKHGKKPDQ